MPEFGVVFDMDGVIMNSNPYHERAWKKFCKAHNIMLADEEFHHYIFGRIAKDTIDYIFKKDHTMAEVNRYVDEKELIYREMYAQNIKLLEGLYSFLEELQRRNIPVAIATSAPKDNVEFVFKYLPISHFFKFVLDASDIEKGKPDPEIYIRVIRKLGIPPNRCIVFEDSLSGIKSALAAGAKVIGVATTHRPEEFDGVKWVIENFVDLHYDHLLSILNE